MLYTDLYHSGFRAFIDGKEVPLLKGMGLFKAVELPWGRHTVEFRFEPPYRYVLLLYLISSVGLIVWGGLWTALQARAMFRGQKIQA